MNMQSNHFPAFAERRPLGDAFEFRSDIVHPKDNPQGQAVFVGLEHIERDTGVRIGSQQIEMSSMTGRRARFYTGDIVYGYLRPYLNKVWTADFDGLCSVDQYVFKVNSNFDRNYVAHFLRSDQFLRTAPIDGTPGQLPRIRSGEIAATQFPVPPLDDQRRIAAILDKADALRRKRKRVVELVRSIPQSLFLQLFGDPQANPGRWNRTSALSDVAKIASGITKGRKEPSTALRTVPYLAVANVQDRALDLRNVKTIEASEEEIRRFRLNSGDLLLTEGGDPDKLGRGTVWRNELPEAIHQNHIFRVQADTNELDPLYLNFLIGSDYGKKYFLRSAKQTTGIASINKSQLSRFPVLLPPLDLQKKFAFEVDRLSASQRCVDRAEEAMLELFISLQHRAFSRRL